MRETRPAQKLLGIVYILAMLACTVWALTGCDIKWKPIPEPTPVATPTPEPTPEPTPTPAPLPTPTPTGCPFNVPHISEVPEAEVMPKIEGRWNVSATPRGRFGRDYYCQPGLWPEACAAGRTFGPVLPDGHPYRTVCEAVFMGQACPVFSMHHCTGTGNECPITFDPFFVIDGVNQNHPRNAGCSTDYVKDGSGHPLVGAWWLASAHGKGYIQACAGDVCTVSTFEVNH